MVVGDGPVPSRRKSYRADPFVRAFLRQGHDLAVVCPFPDQEESWLKHDGRVTFSYTRKVVSPRNLETLAERLLSIADLIRRASGVRRSSKFDFIRSIATIPTFASVEIAGDCPVIANISDFYGELYRMSGLPFKSVGSKILKIVETIALSRCDLLFVDSTVQRRYFQRYGARPTKVVVSPNGFWRELFDPTRIRPYDREELGIDRKTPVIFYHGDISHMDGVDILIKSARLVANKLPECIFLVVGSGSDVYMRYLQSVITQVGVRDHFRFTGWVDHNKIAPLIALADICVAPFRLTLLSNSSEALKVVEYLAMEKRVVASRAEGLKELYGPLLTYANPGDPGDLAERLLLSLRSDPESDAADKRYVANRFEWREIMAHEAQVIGAYLRDPEGNLREFDYRIRPS